MYQALIKLKNLCPDKTVVLPEMRRLDVKKWEDKDLKDLKTLISITVHFILMELQANNYLYEMSSKK